MILLSFVSIDTCVCVWNICEHHLLCCVFRICNGHFDVITLWSILCGNCAASKVVDIVHAVALVMNEFRLVLYSCIFGVSVAARCDCFSCSLLKAVRAATVRVYVIHSWAGFSSV